MKNIDKWLKEQGASPGDFNWSLMKHLVTNALKQDREDREVVIIETDEQYKAYLAEVKNLMDVTDEDSPRGKRLKLLASLIENYECHKYPELHTEGEITSNSMDVDWVQIELDNDFKCIDCNTIVETPYFISTDVPGRCSPLLDGPRCKECHNITTLKRDAEKYEHIQFRLRSRNWATTIMTTPSWHCYSIKHDFFVGDIEYFDGNYIFCAAATDIAFNANAIADIAAFLAALTEVKDV